MKPPSERNQAIAARRAEGATFRAIAGEFGLDPKRVKEIVQRVERYNRGATILQTDPSSLEGLELTGTIPGRTRASLSAAGISNLEELDGMSLVDLLRLPNIGRRQATKLIELYAEIKRLYRGHRSGGEALGSRGRSAALGRARAARLRPSRGRWPTRKHLILRSVPTVTALVGIMDTLKKSRQLPSGV